VRNLLTSYCKFGGARFGVKLAIRAAGQL